MARDVISDASPLIGLAIVDGLAWLPALFTEVWIPPSVQREVLPGVGARGEPENAEAIVRNAIRVWTQPIPEPSLPIPDLDEGETDCMRLALAMGPGNATLIIDERASRAVATELGIRITGTAAVIGLAKQRGLVDSAKAQFERLHATDFRVSVAVIQATLRAVREL